MAPKQKIKLSEHALSEIDESINKIDGWGSIEIIFQNGKVTQITEKNIRKPNATKRPQFN